MSRLVFSALFAFSISVLSFSAVGCGGSGENEVLVDTRSEAEIEQDMADYEAEMEETGDEITE